MEIQYSYLRLKVRLKGQVTYMDVYDYELPEINEKDEVDILLIRRKST